MPESDDFVLTCCRSVNLDPADIIVDSSGRHHLVILDQNSGTAVRFPREATDAEQIETVAIKQQMASDSGLPTPRLIDWVAGEPGVGHLRMNLVGGFGLDDPRIQGLVVRKPTMVANQLTELLLQIRSLDPHIWPAASIDLVTSYAELEVRLRNLQGAVPESFFEQATHAVADARLAAADMELGVMHGDLGGVNTRFDEAGKLVAVLDWDGSRPADIAADVTALAEGLPAEARAELLSSDPSFADQVARCERYVGAWIAQGALWAYDNENWDALADLVGQSDGRRMLEPNTER